MGNNTSQHLDTIYRKMYNDVVTGVPGREEVKL